MSRNQVNNPDDLRKTVKNGKNKRKKANKKALTRLLLLIVVIVVMVMVAKNISKNKKIKLEEVTEYNYFSTLIGEKAGVIDKTGKTVIEPQYDSVQIPNPSKAIFICMDKDGTTKVLNANNKEVLTKYKNVQAIPNNNTSISNTYQTQILKYQDGEKY